MPDTANTRRGTSIADILLRPEILSLGCGVPAASIVAVFVVMASQSIHGLFGTYPWFEFFLFGILPPLAALGMALGLYVLVSGRGRRTAALLGILLNGPAMIISGALLLAR